MQKAIIVFKSLNGITPEYLSELFVNRSDVTEYLLRESVNKLAVPLPRTNFLKNSFSYSGAVLWNSLPSDLRQAESLSDFSHLLNSFYPLKQFLYFHTRHSCKAVFMVLFFPFLD